MRVRLLTAIACMACLLPQVGAAQEAHPGGWNFDIMGISRPAAKSPVKKSRGATSDYIGLSGWGFGLNGTLNAPSGMDVEMGRSFHFFVSDLLGYRARLCKHGALSIGFGLDLKNFSMTGPMQFAVSPTHLVSLAPYPEGAVADYSRMHLLSTTFNLKYIQYIGKFRLAVGPELYVMCPKGKQHQVHTRYTEADGHEFNKRFKGIRTNKVGLNLVGMLSYKGRLGLYVKYTPTQYLREYCGPQFQSISAGVVLGGL